MKLFSATLLAAFASCAYGAIITEQQQQGNQQSAQVGPGPVVSQFAEARDTSYGVPTTTYSDSGFSSYNSKPITYSSGHSVYSNDPGFSFGGSLGTGGAHVQANSLLPTNNLIETGLSIVLGIFALSLVMQVCN